jgi:hypothetical protein
MKSCGQRSDPSSGLTFDHQAMTPRLPVRGLRGSSDFCGIRFGFRHSSAMANLSAHPDETFWSRDSRGHKHGTLFSWF